MIVFDSNVLVYAVNTDAVQHSPSRQAVAAVGERKLAGALFPQNIMEFYAIVTDQRRIPNALEPAVAWEQVKILTQIFTILDPTHDAINTLISISQNVCGAQIFDAYLVAQMIAAGVSTICTYNKKHFEAFAGVIALTPEEILKQFDLKNGDSQ